jgi:hypothetical protein
MLKLLNTDIEENFDKSRDERNKTDKIIGFGIGGFVSVMIIVVSFIPQSSRNKNKGGGLIMLGIGLILSILFWTLFGLAYANKI